MRGRFHPDPCLSHLAAWVRVNCEALTPDRAMAQTFLNWLDAEAGSFSFRTFSDTPYTRLAGTDPLECALHGSLAECWASLVDLNRAGAAVAVTINQTNGRGRAVGDVERVRAVFLDDDRGIDPAAFMLPPHCRVVSSNGHSHCYWRVRGLANDDFVSWQRRLARRYQGDSRVAALNQAMQLPGFWRRKRVAQPHLQSVTYADNQAPCTPEGLAALLQGGQPA